MQLKPEEISKIIRAQIKHYENAIEQSETGTVIMVATASPAPVVWKSAWQVSCLHLKMVHMVWLRTLKKTVYLLCF